MSAEPGRTTASGQVSPVAEWEAVQTAARWLVGAAAAVAAALVAGTQLSALSRLTLDPTGRLVAALAAFLVGLAAVGTILFLAARVLIHPGWTLNKLAHLERPDPTRWQAHWLRQELEPQRGLLTPSEDLHPAQLYRHHRRLLVASFELHEQGQTTLPTDLTGDQSSAPTRTYQANNEADVASLNDRLRNIDTVTSRVVSAANLAHLRRRYRVLVRSLPLAGAVLVIAVVAFIWATAIGPDPVITAPTGVQITFQSDNARIAAAGLPSACAGMTIRGVAVGGTLQRPIVVSTSDPRCVLNQYRVTPDIGVIVPDTKTP